MNQARLFQVIIEPHVSEKVYSVGEKYRQVVFKVTLNATKQEIKKAVEFLFKVKVRRVTTCCVKGKQKVFKNMSGNRPKWKKAYIMLSKGFDIDFTGSDL